MSVYVAAIAANGNGTSSGDVFEGGQFDFNEGVVGVEDVAGEPVRIVHNGGGELAFELATEVQCTVFGMDGRVWADQPLSGRTHVLLNSNASGWVVVRCVGADGLTFTQCIWLNA